MLNEHLKQAQDKIERDRRAAENASKITVTTMPLLASVAQIQSVDSDKKEGSRPVAAHRGASPRSPMAIDTKGEASETTANAYFDELSEIKKRKQEGDESQHFIDNQAAPELGEAIQSPLLQAALAEDSNPSLRFSNSDQDTEMRRLQTGRSGKSSVQGCYSNECYQDETLTEKCIDSSKLYGGQVAEATPGDVLGSQTSRPSSKRTCTTSNLHIGRQEDIYSTAEQRPASSQVIDQGMARSRSEFGMGMQNNMALGARRKTVQAANRQLNQSVRQASNPTGSMLLNTSKGALATETSSSKDQRAKRGSNLRGACTQKSPLASGPLGIGSRLVASRRKPSAILSSALENAAAKGAAPTTHNFRPAEGHATARGKVKSTSYASVQAGLAKGKGSFSGQKTAGAAAQGLGTSNLVVREMAPSQFGSTTNFSQPCHTARQLLRKSPRPSVQGGSRVPFSAGIE